MRARRWAQGECRTAAPRCGEPFTGPGTPTGMPAVFRLGHLLSVAVGMFSGRSYGCAAGHIARHFAGLLHSRRTRLVPRESASAPARTRPAARVLRVPVGRVRHTISLLRPPHKKRRHGDEAISVPPWCAQHGRCPELKVLPEPGRRDRAERSGSGPRLSDQHTEISFLPPPAPPPGAWDRAPAGGRGTPAGRAYAPSRTPTGTAGTGRAPGPRCPAGSPPAPR